MLRAIKTKMAPPRVRGEAAPGAPATEEATWPLGQVMAWMLAPSRIPRFRAPTRVSGIWNVGYPGNIRGGKARYEESEREAYISRQQDYEPVEVRLAAQPGCVKHGESQRDQRINHQVGKLEVRGKAGADEGVRRLDSKPRERTRGRSWRGAVPWRDRTP